MVWKQVVDADGDFDLSVPANEWFWVWGPEFPFPMPGILRESGGSGYWVGKSGRFGSVAITHITEGKHDEAGELVGDAPAAPRVPPAR